MDDFHSRIEEKLKAQADKMLFRRLRVMPPNLRDFTSNDYLGMARSAALANRIGQRLTDRTPLENGSGGSRLLAGNSRFTEETEAYLATISKAESALIFNSGFMANVGVLSCLPQRGDTILYDEHAHASIKDGVRLSLADRFSFRHNDLDDLSRKLTRHKGIAYIVVESVYSMDGDESPLRDIVNLATDHNAIVILDEAHSTGTYGPRGGGLALSMGLQDRIPIRILTFGKAMGVHGACVCGSAPLRDFLINFSRPFIYTTALPSHSVASILCSFEYLGENEYLRDTLRERIALFRKHYKKETGSTSAIQPIRVPGNENARAAADYLQQRGFDVRPVLSPTVREGTERLRICLHAFNSENDIIELASELNRLDDDESTSG